MDDVFAPQTLFVRFAECVFGYAQCFAPSQQIFNVNDIHGSCPRTVFSHMLQNLFRNFPTRLSIVGFGVTSKSALSLRAL